MRRALVAHASTSLGIATLVVLALSGCAAGLRDATENSAAGDAPYVGVFTGQYVDGKPLYRFPAIHVVGSRRSVEGL